MAKAISAYLPLENGEMLSGENFADRANAIMKQFDKRELTTTKLRGLYAQIMNIYTAINSSADFEQQRGNLQYLKVKFAYEASREKAVRGFLDETQLMRLIDSVKDYDSFILYCRYAESLVAYFKFYGGRD